MKRAKNREAADIERLQKRIWQKQDAASLAASPEWKKVRESFLEQLIPYLRQVLFGPDEKTTIQAVIALRTILNVALCNDLHGEDAERMLKELAAKVEALQLANSRARTNVYSRAGEVQT